MKKKYLKSRFLLVLIISLFLINYPLFSLSLCSSSNLSNGASASIVDFFKKEDNKTYLFLDTKDPRDVQGIDAKLASYQVFKKSDKLYFYIYNKNGFKSDYLKYQIVKQDDNAHIGGYTRIQNKTIRLKNKNYYLDYFVLNQSGKYYIQIFDITNLNQWIAFGEFRVVDE